MTYGFLAQRDAGDVVTVPTSDPSAFLNVVLDKPSNGRRSSDVAMATAVAAPVAAAAVSVKTVPKQILAPTGEGAALSVAQLRPRIRGGLPPHALRRVREFIEAHLAESISIQALAAIAGLSMYHFARAFKRSEGMTPHDYLVQCRVRRAQHLLISTGLSLAEIALESGFADQSHCARRFREHIGVTPGSYRWSMR